MDAVVVEEKQLERCVNQLFLPKPDVPFKRECGYCSICEYDPEKNGLCKDYHLVKVRVFYVSE